MTSTPVSRIRSSSLETLSPISLEQLPGYQSEETVNSNSQILDSIYQCFTYKTMICLIESVARHKNPIILVMDSDGAGGVAWGHGLQTSDYIFILRTLCL